MIRPSLSNLQEFLRGSGDAMGRADRLLAGALKEGLSPVFDRARSYAPKRSGSMASGSTLEIGSDFAEIVFPAEYSLVNEWAYRGRYSSLTARHGAPPRFGFRALEEQADRAVDLTTKELLPALALGGWARGV